MSGWGRLRREQTGAEIAEFALVAPILLLAIFGLIYAMLAAAAHVSLAHASSVAVRYASLPVDPVLDVYPSLGQVTDKLHASTPFFGTGSCTTALTGDSTANSRVVLTADCRFPNPLGRTLNALAAVVGGEPQAPEPGDGPYVDSSDITISSTAKARRE